MVKKIALVILEQPNGDIALQLRDDKPTIAHPNHWALFGGKIEEGEQTKQAALKDKDFIAGNQKRFKTTA